MYIFRGDNENVGKDKTAVMYGFYVNFVSLSILFPYFVHTINILEKKSLPVIVVLIWTFLSYIKTGLAGLTHLPGSKARVYMPTLY